MTKELAVMSYQISTLFSETTLDGYSFRVFDDGYAYSTLRLKLLFRSRQVGSAKACAFGGLFSSRVCEPFRNKDLPYAWYVSGPHLDSNLRGRGLGKLLYASLALAADAWLKGSYIIPHDYINMCPSQYRRGTFTSESALRVWDSFGEPFLHADKARKLFDFYNEKYLAEGVF